MKLAPYQKAIFESDASFVLSFGRDRCNKTNQVIDRMIVHCACEPDAFVCWMYGGSISVLPLLQRIADRIPVAGAIMGVKLTGKINAKKNEVVITGPDKSKTARIRVLTSKPCKQK